MIIRLLVLMLSGVMAYLMLRGWPAAVSAFPRAFMAVFLVAVTLAWWATGKKPKDLPLVRAGRRPGWLDFGAVGLGLLAIECGFLWFLSAAPKPLEALAIQLEHQFRPEAAERREAREAGVTSGNWLWDDQRRRPLPMRTNLKPGMKPEVFVRLMNGKDAERLLNRRLYVRAFALDRYVNGAWSLSDAGSQVLTADDKGWIRFSKQSESEILHEVFHGKDESGLNPFTGLLGARAVRLPSLAVNGEGLAILPKSDDDTGYEYLVSSLPIMLADVAEEDLKDAVVKSPNAGSRLGQLVLRVAGEGGLLDRLKKIESYLRDSYRYSLVTDNKRNLDPIENFLFEEKRGHCEFFATSAALMARELGVEVRVGYGWAGGKYFESQHMFVFRANEAHAWLEVKLAGYGWVLVEPTPPIDSGSALPRTAEAGEKTPSPDEMIPQEEAVFSKGAEKITGWAIGLTAGFGVSAFLLFVLRGRTREDVCGESGAVTRARREKGYLAAWRRALGKRGMGHEAGLSLRRQIGMMETAPDFSNELVRYHYAVSYEGHPVDVKLERRLEKEIHNWKAP